MIVYIVSYWNLKIVVVVCFYHPLYASKKYLGYVYMKHAFIILFF